MRRYEREREMVGFMRYNYIIRSMFAARHVLVSYMYAYMSTTDTATTQNHNHNHNHSDRAASERESDGPVGILLVRSPPPVSLAYPPRPKKAHTMTARNK